MGSDLLILEPSNPIIELFFCLVDEMHAEFRVGIGVFVFNPTGNFIVGKRKGSYGAGTWSLPGGHLDLGESFEACAARELLEETGLVVQLGDVRFLTAINDHVDEDLKHYITIFMGCCLPAPTEIDGRAVMPEVQNLEPEKCEGWEWTFWDDLVANPDDSPQHSHEPQVDVASERDERSNLDERRVLFLPMLNLLKQRPGFDPLQTYLAATTAVVKSQN